MSLILGYRYNAIDIKKLHSYKDANRKCGMNDLVWIDNRYPSRREKNAIISKLADDEVAIIFDSNDNAVECLKKDF